ncbi:MAG: GNAT family N-acetyltransferase [Desulfobacterales bacterium]|nr:GNAT family N-acetyltransferase [Desulfobacterales bacterium]MBF0396977.1 GNAT family N-acetyltransferase [Desulfobacterales bacterium]
MNNKVTWEDRVVSPKKILEKIEPGMSIFLSTGMAEPRTLVKSLVESDASNLQDLELIQLASFGDALSVKELRSNKYRLKTFFSGWTASDAISEGRVDLIPSRFYQATKLFESKRINIDVAFVQITPPNDSGYCSFGPAIDVARQAMELASIIVGEINPNIPLIYGDTFVPISDFHMLVRSTENPYYFKRWEINDVYDKVAANVASIIDDGCCIGYYMGPLFEALTKYLVHKRNLGIHSPSFTDPIMDLIKSGAVTNRNKEIFRGKSIASYALGTPELMKWLDRNPLVEFQAVDKVFNPLQIGKNPRFVAIIPGRKADISGRVVLQSGKGNLATGPTEVVDFLNGAELSQGGYVIFALPSRNLKEESNIRLTLEGFENQFILRESVDIVVTEYGVASLKGRTLRERAQAMIEIAHPDDRPSLIDEAKKAKIIYQDQIFLRESTHLYPSEIATKHVFKNDISLRFRAIKPSDEEEMRRLFYRFSDEAVYYRYFTPIKAMPHSKMQAYVNIDYNRVMSVVALRGEPGQAKIIAEARYVKDYQRNYADVAFIVDEEYQGIGVASFMYQMLTKLAKERGIQGFTADVLASNKGMMKVFEKGAYTFNAKIEHGVYEIVIPFENGH